MTRTERELLATWKRFFRVKGNKGMHKQLIRIEKQWSSLEDVQKQHVFDTLNRFFSK